MQHPYIIGISGGSGSGKTSFIKSLMNHFLPHEVCLISLDNYYKPKEQQPIDANGIQNYDTPESIDFEQFMHDLATIIEGKEVQRLEYDFNNPNYVPSMLTFNRAPVIVLEGVFLYCYQQLENMIEFRIFIETQEHLRLKRRILRDIKERGYPVDETLYYIEHHVTPGYAKYVEPYRNECDMIILNNKNFEKAVELVAGHLKQKSV